MKIVVELKDLEKIVGHLNAQEICEKMAESIDVLYYTKTKEDINELVESEIIKMNITIESEKEGE